MRQTLKIGLAMVTALLLAGGAAQAAPVSPVGFWVTDDRSAVVQVYECGTRTLCGALVGFPFDHPTDPSPLTWNKQPQCRFVFIRNMHPRTRAWGGSIVNPVSGRVFGAKLKVIGPDKLLLRGYLLLPILGANRTWLRYEGPPPPADCRMGPDALRQ